MRDRDYGVLAGVLQLKIARERNDPLIAKQAVGMLRPTFKLSTSDTNPESSIAITEWIIALDALQSGGHLSAYLSGMLAGLRVIYWIVGKADQGGNLPEGTELALGLFASDRKYAVAYYLLSGEVQVCPHCHKLFTSRPGHRQEYHSIACREAHRVARWRARNKLKKLKVSKRKRTTRGKR